MLSFGFVARARLTILCCLLFWASEFTYHAIVDWGPTLLNIELGFKVEEASSIILLASLLVACLLPLVGLVSDFIGRRKAFAIPAFVGFIGVIALGYFTLTHARARVSYEVITTEL